MNFGYYRRLALSNIKKNYRFFVPRMITEAGLVGCFYIILTLAMDNRLSKVRGGNYIPGFMIFGACIVAGLSLILMFYVNSFLMRQRKREFGLYNVLGMEKRHIVKVLLRESFYSSVLSVGVGICFGMLFYKLCSLLICKILQADVIIGFYFITWKTILPAMGAFALIDIAAFIVNAGRIFTLKPVELLNSMHIGEREPKIKWFLLVVGVLTTGAGYWISVTTQSPLEAILWFFAAVALVIIGTYCLFVTGSTFVLKLMKRNQRFYYHKRRMTAVSGLLYRMKQNAVGLASITILACAVLVMLSTTSSLYIGLEDTLASKYPYDLYISASYNTTDGKMKNVPQEVLCEALNDAAEKCGVTVDEVSKETYLEVTFLLADGKIVGSRDQSLSEIAHATSFCFITQEQYESLTHEALDLKPGEVAVSPIVVMNSDRNTVKDVLTLGDRSYKVACTLVTYPIEGRLSDSSNCYGVVLPSEEDLQAIDEYQQACYGENASGISTMSKISFREKDKIMTDCGMLDVYLSDNLTAYTVAQPDCDSPCMLSFDSVWAARENYIGVIGTLLFLGLLLGAVFIFATVLIIYYKQISEGYEDRQRFQIMEKIGMSSQEVKKSIRGQILLVFFLPLIVSAVHIAVAFPILNRLLKVLQLVNASLFAWCTVGAFGLFALIYLVIYSVTARTYYKIVH